MSDVCDILLFLYSQTLRRVTLHTSQGRKSCYQSFANRWSQNRTLIAKLTNFRFEFSNKNGIFMIRKDQIFRKCKKPDIENFISYFKKKSFAN